MKKQYMDFVPAGKAVVTLERKVTVASGRKAVARPATRTVSGVKSAKVRSVTRVTRVEAVKSAKPVKPVAKVATKEPARAREIAQVRATERVGFVNEGKMGVIEELNPKFVKTDVPKRPLSDKSHFRAEQSEIAKIKARKVVEKPVENPAKKSVEKPKAQAEKKERTEAYQVPKTPFINQGKVEKRPLSKNVYAKKIEVATEEPKGPVTIISKPESQAHVGLIVTIILTIILGAAAGTVAFLLLPK